MAGLRVAIPIGAAALVVLFVVARMPYGAALFWGIIVLGAIGYAIGSFFARRRQR